MCIRRSTSSITDQSDESWPIEPLAPHLARANKMYKSAIDLMYAYADTPLDEETIKITSFSFFFMLLKVRFLGHEISYNTIKPIHSNVAAIHKIPSATEKELL